MKVTREVIYDLLPGYFAGEVSADTRALIDEFLATDPEFARMTARFRRLFDERAPRSGKDAPERADFERARSRAEGLQISGAFAIAYSLAALFPLLMNVIRDQPPFRGPALVLSIVFGAVAFGSAVGWLWLSARRIRSV